MAEKMEDNKKKNELYFFIRKPRFAMVISIFITLVGLVSIFSLQLEKYPNITAVDHISFEVKDGEVVGFLGPNGAGKSTTMNMITGYIEPTEGQIIINRL